MNRHALAALEFSGVQEKVRALLASAPGEAAAREWSPASDPAAVDRLLDETDQMRVFLAEGADLPLSGLILPDEILRKARPAGACLLPAELMAIRRLCLVNRLCRSALLPQGARVPLLAELARSLPGLHLLEEEISGVLDEEGEFRDHASKELYRLRQSITATRERLTALYRGFLARHGGEGIFQEDIIATRAGRWVLLVKAQARGRMPGVVLDRTESGQALYLEPQEAVEINNRLLELKDEKEAEKKRLLGQLTDAVRGSGESLIQASRVIGSLDLVRARALFGLPRRHVRPTFSDDGEMVVRAARHPLLEGLEGRQVVPLDLELPGGQPAAGHARGRALVITGPNTGGKTVALKTAGLLILMAQSGLFVPAAEGTSLPLFREVFADIGDEQSLEQSLSTFSAHVRNIAEALRDAGPDCLVILDELGAGTDPAEGAPLAMAVVEHLLERGALVLASTHHGSLVAFASRTPGAVNASMEFDQETLRPTYRLIMGVPGRSHAREVARQMGVPETVVQRSSELQPGMEKEVSGLAAELDRRRREMEATITELETRKKEFSLLLQERAVEMEALRRGRAEAVAKARAEALQILDRTRSEVREILAVAATRPGTAHRQLHDLRRGVERELPRPDRRPDRPLEGTPRIGQRVRLPNTAAEGKVAAVDEEKRVARVEVQGKMVDVPFHSLGEAAEKTKRASPGGVFQTDAPLPSGRLDIRGLRGEEADTRVVQFLDQAWLAGLETVEILHGKGLGRLKDLVARLAADHPGTREFHPAPEERGGAGITVVNFK